MAEQNPRQEEPDPGELGGWSADRTNQLAAFQLHWLKKTGRVPPIDRAPGVALFCRGREEGMPLSQRARRYGNRAVSLC